MRYESFDLEVNTSAGQFGAAQVVDRFWLKTVQAHGNFAGGWSVQLQGVVGSHDDWVDIGTPLTAASVVEVTGSYKRFRCKTVAAGTGAATFITFAGQDLRVGE